MQESIGEKKKNGEKRARVQLYISISEFFLIFLPKIREKIKKIET